SSTRLMLLRPFSSPGPSGLALLHEGARAFPVVGRFGNPQPPLDGIVPERVFVGLRCPARDVERGADRDGCVGADLLRKLWSSGDRILLDQPVDQAEAGRFLGAEGAAR